MAKIKKTREQKIKADMRRQVAPQQNYSYTPQSFQLTQPAKEINQSPISAILSSSQYSLTLKHDLLKTALACAVIICLELVTFLLLKTHRIQIANLY